MSKSHSKRACKSEKICKSERRHDEVVRDLEKTLEGKFDKIETFKEYRVGDICGEVDLLATRGNYQEWYEVKVNGTPKRVGRAREQFERYQRTHPEFNGVAYCYDSHGNRVRLN